MSYPLIAGTKSYRLAVVYNNVTASTPAVSNAHQVWYDLGDHPLIGDTIDINIDKAENKAAIADLLETAKVTSLPVVFFIEQEAGQEQQKILTRLTGNPSYSSIKNTLQAIIAKRFKEDGSGTSSSDGKEGGNPLGWLGLFKMPKYLWYIVAAASGVKALDSKGTGQIVYGGVSIYALHRATKK